MLTEVFNMPICKRELQRVSPRISKDNTKKEWPSDSLEMVTSMQDSKVCKITVNQVPPRSMQSHVGDYIDE